MKKWLKVIVVLVILAVAVVYAQRQQGRQHNTNDVKARVERIYGHVAKTYNECNRGNELTLPKENFDKEYCSDDWNATLKKALESQPDSDDIGPFDYDYWIVGQDFGHVSVSDVKVVKLEGNNAIVKLNLHNLGSVSKINLKMVYERNNWYIDDMAEGPEYDSINGLKCYMKEYIMEIEGNSKK